MKKFLKYIYKAYIKKNIVSNIKKRKIGKVGGKTLLETPFDYGDYPGYIYIGNDTAILKNARINIYSDETITDPKVDIGNNCYIGMNFSALARDPIIIEDRVLIASNVLVSSENHGIDPESNKSYMEQNLTGNAVRIGKGSWIGEKAIILPGVIIGEKCIIGAGSVVTKSVPDFSIAVGNPAKVIKKYDFKNHVWERC